MARLKAVLLGGTLSVTDGVTTPIFTLPLASGAHLGGSFDYTVICADGTECGAMSKHVLFAATNKAGVATTHITSYDEQAEAFSDDSVFWVNCVESLSVSSSILTVSITPTFVGTPTTATLRWYMVPLTTTQATVF